MQIVAKPIIYLANYQDIPAYNTAVQAIISDLERDYAVKSVTVNMQNIDAISIQNIVHMKFSINC